MYICCNSYVRGLLWKAVFNWNGLPSLKITLNKNKNKIFNFVFICVSVKAMLMLIDCKYKLEERLDVRRKFKTVSKVKTDDVEGKELLKDVDQMTDIAAEQGLSNGQITTEETTVRDLTLLLLVPFSYKLMHHLKPFAIVVLNGEITVYSVDSPNGF